MDHPLWSSLSGIVFIFLVVIISIVSVIGASRILNIKNIKDNWPQYRCSPTVMPFASLYGYNASENFNFCMGKVFTTHSASAFGSFSSILGDFTTLLHTIFNSIGSLRNTIATLGGGINVIFQEFTERLSSFFYEIRLSAIRIKSMIYRMYAILFSVMYMGISGITSVSSFTNTFLFGFLDTFCFPGHTMIETSRGVIPIKDVILGDVLPKTESHVTGLFRFYAKGQPMVRIGATIVSTNHYVEYQGKWIMASEHPYAVTFGNWGDESLYCLNTSNHKIPINDLIFLDYDETEEADEDTMRMIEKRINSSIYSKQYNFTEYAPCIAKGTLIKVNKSSKPIEEIQIGDELSTGSKVVGLIKRTVKEICNHNSLVCTPSILVWDKEDNIWKRVGNIAKLLKKSSEMYSLIVVPNSQIELDDGTYIRDYMELCSPDSEIHYSTCLSRK